MAQSHGVSFAEAIFNTVVGFSINFILNLVILPMYGFPIKPGAAFSMGLIFTVVSVARGFGVRRLFERPAFAAFMERANAHLNRYLGAPIGWLKTRLASATRRAPSAAPTTTSPATMTVTPTASRPGVATVRREEILPSAQAQLALPLNCS